jgi:hypothetical protein
MQSNRINFFQVSFKKNIPIIEKNYLNLKKFYKNFSLTIICNDKEIIFFKKLSRYPEIKIIKESFFITINDFKKIFNKYCKNKIFLKKTQWRINWYYQQVLKISYIFYFFNKNIGNKLILWDADTLILNKVEFFNKNHSNVFGTLFEFNKKYFETLLFIFKKLPKHYLSGVCQFNSISKSDFIFLKKKLKKFIVKKHKNSVWISHLVGKAVFSTHKNYFVSLFSEYNLLIINRLLSNNSKQKPVLYFRSNMKGELSNIQFLILKKLGFVHLTYDHYDKVVGKKINNIRFLCEVFKLMLIYFPKYTYFFIKSYFLFNKIYKIQKA